MQIQFVVNGVPVEFHRDQLIGSAELRLPDQVISLQSPLNPLTHFSLKLTQTWQREIAGSQVVIEKVRPLLFAAFRASRYRVSVDGVLVAETSGM